MAIPKLLLLRVEEDDDSIDPPPSQPLTTTTNPNSSIALSLFCQGLLELKSRHARIYMNDHVVASAVIDLVAKQGWVAAASASARGTRIQIFEIISAPLSTCSRRRRTMLILMEPDEKPCQLTTHDEGLFIPDELIMDILSRLPIKFLMPFNSVSKSFNSLIKDNHFLNLHRSRRPSPISNINPLIIFWEPHDADSNISYLNVKSLLKTPPTITNEFKTLSSNWKDPYTPIGSCNGLVCLIGTRYDHDQHLFWVSFWNPTTGSTSEKLFRLPLTMSHSHLHVYSGFGYNNLTETYKVLFIDRNQDVLVFNMGDKNWRHVACFPPDLTPPSNGDIIGVHINGTLNWLAILKVYEDNYHCDFDEYQRVEWDNGSSMILSFDLGKEEFVRLSLPAMRFRFEDPHLGVLGECLCVSLYDIDNFWIWQMKEFGVDRSWTKLFKINYVLMFEDDLPPAPLGFPLHMFENGDLLMLLEDYLINVRDNRLTPLQFADKMNLPHAMICCESLISPC